MIPAAMLFGAPLGLTARGSFLELPKLSFDDHSFGNFLLVTIASPCLINSITTNCFSWELIDGGGRACLRTFDYLMNTLTRKIKLICDLSK
jgi:hypothetical protein